MRDQLSDGATMNTPARVCRAPRASQRGQMMLILALMATVIFGGVALAVDLGVQAHHRRSLQNSSDMAALAAARDLPGTADLPTAQQNAADDAVRSLVTQGIWWGGGGAPANDGCGARAIAGYCFTTTYTAGDGTYTVSFSTPPLTPRNLSTNPQTTFQSGNYAEVDLRQRSTNGFGSFVGQPQSTAGSHSVAYHWGPGGSFGFALYSQTLVGTGNQPEDVLGDVYIGSAYAPQSSGLAALCADRIPGSTTLGGRIVFGAPQPPNSGGGVPAVNQPAAAKCPYSGGTLNAMAPPTECPRGQFITWNPKLNLCLANPAIQPPAFPEPVPATPPVTRPPALPQASCTITKATSPGVYEVNPAGACGSSITLDFSSGDISCISLVLDAGSTVLLSGAQKGTPSRSVPPSNLTSYGDASCAALGLPGAGDPANRSVIWAAPTAVVTIKDDASPGCCRVYDFFGAVDMPSGNASIRKNAALEITGQTVVSNWDVQSGNHPNPVVTYAPGDNPQNPEVLRLVE